MLKCLSDLVEVESGYAFKSNKFSDENKDGLPLIRIRDVNAGISTTFYQGEYDHKYLVSNGDLLITMDGEFIIKEWNGGTALLNQRVCRIKSKSEGLYKKFLLYVMPEVLKKIEDKTPYVTVKHLSVKKIKEAKINLPPLDDQIKIVKVLDLVVGLINRRKSQINALYNLRQSIFNNMFGDIETNTKNFDIKTFDYFATIDNKMIKDFKDWGDHPYVAIENIEKETGKLINIGKVKEFNLKSGKYYFSNQHIIYSKIRPYLNKVALPDFSGLCSADAYPILVNSDHANRTFFTYVLRSSTFLNYINKGSSRTNIPKTNRKQLREFKTICPPLELQSEFSNVMREIDTKQLLFIKSLNQYKDLYNSLLHQLLEGQLWYKRIGN